MVTIKKATQAQTIAAIKSGDFSVIDTINKKARKEAIEIFASVAGSVIKLAYWDMSPVKRRDGKKVYNAVRLAPIDEKCGLFTTFLYGAYRERDHPHKRQTI
nr:MAG TPA: hypothetical protein [Caudoviricetes sp.]